MNFNLHLRSASLYVDGRRMAKKKTYAADVAQEQLKRIVAVQLHVVEQSLSGDDVASASDSNNDDDIDERQLADLRHAMHKLESARAFSLTRQKLVESIPNFPLPDRPPDTVDVGVLRTLYLSQLATLVEAIYSERLMQEAESLEREHDYWNAIDTSIGNTLLYLVQS